jgi:beta-phosphoglucomutase-like phosphatase (HAD superfamily)
MMNNKSLRLLILDCDGVLIRSERANLAYYNHLFRLYGLPEVRAEDREKMSLLHTLSTPQVIDTFFPTLLREDAKTEALGLEFSKFSGLLEVEEGWSEVLRRLTPCLDICVATNRGGSAAGVLEAVGLLPWIGKIFTILDVKRPKPAPDLLHAALEHFGAAAGEAVYIGDSGLDREAADAAGIAFIGFRYPSPRRINDPWELETALCTMIRGERKENP